MTALAEIVMTEAAYGRMPPEKQVSKFMPEQIRQTIADLVAGNQLTTASALVDAGLSLHPCSEDILSIGALVAEIHQDWTRAKELLQALMKLQKGASPPETWLHWIRVLRCQEEHHAALRSAKQAYSLFPDHAALHKEYVQLMDMTQNPGQLEPVAKSQ